MSFSVSGKCDAEKFVGNWETVELIEVDEGEPWPCQTEVSYPKKLKIYCENNKLKMLMETQFGSKGNLAYIVDNNGNDIIFTAPFLQTKDSLSFSVKHHIKIFNDTLHGSTYGRVRLFEWRALRNDR
ncbi:hypothetical protein CHISP_0685 [Chitinispirillum alkaliphilum]|nr:hypothetical protein CHISP_0685 [Chitinispirillum alkaliphilum]